MRWSRQDHIAQFYLSFLRCTTSTVVPPISGTRTSMAARLTIRTECTYSRNRWYGDIRVVTVNIPKVEQFVYQDFVTLPL
jgi:hypothetical protein